MSNKFRRGPNRYTLMHRLTHPDKEYIQCHICNAQAFFDKSDAWNAVEHNCQTNEWSFFLMNEEEV